MSDDSQRPIIVKRIKKGGHGHHGGAWKIAYADLVTAMMAFFLLMWLLGSTAKGDLQGIASYFKTPLKVALQGGSGSGDSSSVVRGGGTDLTRANGQVKRGDMPSKKAINLRAAKSNKQMAEQQMLNTLEKKLVEAIKTRPALAQFKNQVLVDMTAEGLRIQIVDEQNRPMFNTGSAILQSYSKEILHEIGALLNEVPNRISLSGHTDSLQYAGGAAGYSNWELSADRANTSRRELIVGGMQADKILRVLGQADAIPLNKEDPANPINRRISITVLNEATEQNIIRESGSLQDSTTTQLGIMTADDLKPEAHQ